MTKLPSPEQWVLSRMDERECAELIEQHIDFYVESDDGFRRSVHLPTEFVRHYRQRHDGALPTVVAVATSPLVLADGSLVMRRLLLLDIGFALGKGMHVGDGELADPRRDAIDVAQWWHGGDYLADDIVEHVHHWQERRV